MTDQLVWSGRSRTVDPGKLGRLIKEILDEAAEEMRMDSAIRFPAHITQNRP
jgi:hypothetical protein